jgi:hypothetical protein
MTKRLLSPRSTTVVTTKMINTPAGRFARDAPLMVVLAASLGSAVGALPTPSAEDLPARASGVLAVLFLIFNEAYLATSPDNTKDLTRSRTPTQNGRVVLPWFDGLVRQAFALGLEVT